MDDMKVGSFVRYVYKNELGLVGVMTEHGAKCWFHCGGTKAMCPYDILEVVDDVDAKNLKYTNDYAKKSLFERKRRLLEGGDVSDLIDI